MILLNTVKNLKNQFNSIRFSNSQEQRQINCQNNSKIQMNEQQNFLSPSKFSFKNYQIYDDIDNDSLSNKQQQQTIQNYCKSYLSSCHKKQAQNQQNQQNLTAKSPNFQEIDKTFTYKNGNSMFQLLNNCKLSIVQLQNQLKEEKQKNQNLKKHNQSLSKKLNQAQNQVQRNYKIIQMYIKEGKCIVSEEKRENINRNKQLTIKKQQKQEHTIKQLQLQIKKFKQKLNACETQNQRVKQKLTQNLQQTLKLRIQNQRLNQKIHKMGKGVNKAISTINKNKNSYLDYKQYQTNQKRQNNNFFNVSLETPSKFGKIRTTSLHQHSNSNKSVQLYQTSGKRNYNQQNNQSLQLMSPVAPPTTLSRLQSKRSPTTAGDFDEQSHKMSPIKSFSTLFVQTAQKQFKISLQKQRIDKMDKMQRMLKRMYEISQKNDQSDSQDKFQKVNIKMDFTGMNR